MKLPTAKERSEQDTVQLLQAMGVPVLEEQDLAIRKGLALNIENRYHSIEELYQGIYGEPI